MRLIRFGGLLGTVASVLLVSAPIGEPAAATPAPALAVDFNQAIYGDFALAGNTVTTCPRRPGHHPVQLCWDALQRRGSGVAAQNNGHPMAWVDVDGSATTYNSSSARLLIPPGARIAHAVLTWAGNTGMPDGRPCGRGTVAPPGSAHQQAVSVTVNETSTSVRPQRFVEDTGLGLVDQQFYSGRADLTGVLHRLSGQLTITVGNVWTPQGYDCFGGWSVLAVWAFDGPQHRFAPARRQVTVYDGHVRLRGGQFRATARTPAIRPAGGRSRIGLTAFEGDWAMPGDRFLVNGYDPARTENFFAASAEGRLNPSYPNNMSVDVRTTEVATEVIKAGDRSAELIFTSGLDAYLVRGVAVSTPMPELVATTSVDRAAVHPGDEVTQTVSVTNTGGAPAVDIRVRADLGPACDYHLAQLDPGRTATARCTRTVADTDPRPSTEVSGQSLIGDRLTARAQAAIEVLRPALTVTKTAAPDTVLNGQKVDYEITVTNTGNTGLSTVVIDDARVDACDAKDVGALAPGAARTVRCSVVAGDDGFTNTVTASGTDRLGKRVIGEARAAFSVVHPRLTMTVVPSTHAVRPGHSVRLTVTVTNASPIWLAGVRVAGTPAACARELGTLAPNQVVSYACEVAVVDRLSTNLTATATPVIAGQPVPAWRDAVRGAASVIVSVVPPTLPPPPSPPPRPEVQSPPRPEVQSPPVARAAAKVPPPSPVPIASMIAGLAVLNTFVSIGGIAATASRPKR